MASEHLLITMNFWDPAAALQFHIGQLMESEVYLFIYFLKITFIQQKGILFIYFALLAVGNQDNSPSIQPIQEHSFHHNV